MGLGKTVQCIAFLAWLQSTNTTTKKIRPHLIVVPGSTLSNWENEFQRFCPSLVILTYHGSQNERFHLRRDIRRRIENGEVDVILCTYTIFERESGKDDRKFMTKTSFEFMILDEGHCIKNANSSRYTNMNMIHSRRRLLLSGTPVQNDVSELLAILSFLMSETFTKLDCELLVAAFKSTDMNDDSINQLRGE
jgi:SWI/SNF-related matrix-associated actin-dependent regulator 1 of chromatin subfamily A